MLTLAQGRQSGPAARAEKDHNYVRLKWSQPQLPLPVSANVGNTKQGRRPSHLALQGGVCLDTEPFSLLVSPLTSSLSFQTNTRFDWRYEDPAVTSPGAGAEQRTRGAARGRRRGSCVERRSRFPWQGKQTTRYKD